MIRAETLEELVDASVLLSEQPLPLGRRVAVLTNAGGLGILAADACEAAGLELPTLADESGAARGAAPVRGERREPGRHARVGDGRDVRAVLPPAGGPGVDAVLVLFVPPVTATADEVALAVDRAAAGERRSRWSRP